MKKAAFVVILTLSFSAVIFAQTDDLKLRSGVTPNKSVDEIYRQFSEAYRTLNVDLVANLYTQNAAYLVPDDEVMTGREKIRTSFQGFFDYVKSNGQTMTISFDIVQRTVDKNIGYDVGIYTLRRFKDGKEISSGQGKFVVVAVKETDGRWRFQVDGYSDIKPKLAAK